MAVHIDKSTIYSTNGKQIWGKTLESMEWCLVRNKIKHWNKYKIGKSPTHVGKIFPFPPPVRFYISCYECTHHIQED